MHLYRFIDGDDETIVSAPKQSKAIEIYEGDTGDLHRTPSQMYGGIEFALEPGTDTGLAVRMKADDGYIHAIADADVWAAHWPNQVIEFAEMWGEQ